MFDQALAVPVGDAPHDRAGSLEPNSHLERPSFANSRWSRACEARGTRPFAKRLMWYEPPGRPAKSNAPLSSVSASLWTYAGFVPVVRVSAGLA